MPKRDSGTGAFLWILRKFSEHLFLRSNSGDCFCIMSKKNIEILFFTTGKNCRLTINYLDILRCVKLFPQFDKFKSINEVLETSKTTKLYLSYGSRNLIFLFVMSISCKNTWVLFQLLRVFFFSPAIQQYFKSLLISMTVSFLTFSVGIETKVTLLTWNNWFY